MLAPIIAPLSEGLRALRTIQAPDHIQPAEDRPEGFRISSAAFGPGRDGSISVDLEQSLLLAGITVENYRPHLPRSVALLAPTVRELRGQGLQVSHVPLLDNRHHGEARFDGLSRTAIRRAARYLAENVEVVMSINADEARRQVAIREARSAQGA